MPVHIWCGNGLPGYLCTSGVANGLPGYLCASGVAMGCQGNLQTFSRQGQHLPMQLMLLHLLDATTMCVIVCMYYVCVCACVCVCMCVCVHAYVCMCVRVSMATDSGQYP